MKRTHLVETCIRRTAPIALTLIVAGFVAVTPPVARAQNGGGFALPADPDGPYIKLQNGKLARLQSLEDVKVSAALTEQWASTYEQTVLHTKLLPPYKHVLPLAADNTEWQTAIRNQGNRGTCTYFGVTAALEAMYKRAGYGDLDLSEEYFTWLRDVTLLADAENPAAPSQTNAWYRESHLGSLSGGGGGYNVQLLQRYGIPMESDEPYIGDGGIDNYMTWPGYAGYGLSGYRWDLQTFPGTPIDMWNFAPAQLPEAARNRAQYGVQTAVLLTAADVQNPNTIESLIAAGHDVVLSLTLHNTPGIPGNPVWQCRVSDPVVGGHCVLVVGYDHNKHALIIKNSWGFQNYDLSSLNPEWRTMASRFNGYTFIDYSYLAAATEGAVVLEPRAPGANNNQRALGLWDVNFYQVSTRRLLGHMTLAWRHLPNTAFWLAGADYRIGDLIDPDGNVLRVNGRLDGGVLGPIHLYVDFEHPATHPADTRGMELIANYRVFGVGPCTMDSRAILRGTDTGDHLYGVPISDVSFFATHR